MTDTARLLDTLKKLLKAQGLTYAEVAPRVGLSEASVKRLFSARTFTLARLDAFCRLLDIDFFDLAKLARGRGDEVREMSERQETALAHDAKLLGVFYLLLSDWTVDDISAGYELTQPELTRLLVRLDRLQLIELLPHDRVRLKVPKLLRLHPGGPIHRAHGKRVVDEFIAAEFDRVGGHFRFEYRELSKASYALMQRRLERITAEFLEIAELDGTMPSRQRETIGLLLAMRPWALSLVTGLTPRATRR
ncbi:MAG: helix-turn-helix domain-containing protein [Burkholderiales bacterium]|jgi:transcriptional regulator with XRE-family HTH domain